MSYVPTIASTALKAGSESTEFNYYGAISEKKKNLRHAYNHNIYI